MKKQVVRILINLERIRKIKDEFEEMFEEISEHCNHHVPPKDPAEEDEFDSIHGCTHNQGAICCVDECPLYIEEETNKSNLSPGVF